MSRKMRNSKFFRFTMWNMLPVVHWGNGNSLCFWRSYVIWEYARECQYRQGFNNGCFVLLMKKYKKLRLFITWSALFWWVRLKKINFFLSNFKICNNRSWSKCIQPLFFRNLMPICNSFHKGAIHFCSQACVYMMTRVTQGILNKF